MRKYDKMYPGTGGTWQGIINARYLALRANRAIDPTARILMVADRFKHLNMAAHYRYRLRILFDLMGPAEIRAHKRCARYHLHIARYECPRPRLP